MNASIDFNKKKKAYYEANKEEISRKRKEFRKNNPDNVENWKRHRFQKKYGITIDQKEDIFNSQGRKCAICGSEKSGHRFDWCLDHNHISGQIRGVLCNDCNALLGYAKEDVNLMKEAISYLEQHEKHTS